MADPKLAVDFVLRQEDPTLSGEITNRSSDRGGMTRFGLTAKWNPSLIAKGFFSSSMSAAVALPLAEETYEQAYCVPLGIAGINSQALATALLSIGVLEGQGTAANMFRSALNTVSPIRVPAVGSIDGVAVTAANACDAGSLRRTLVSLAQARFTALAQNDPSQQANLRGWTNRMNALLAIPLN